jgi:hypothetical protein
VWKTLGFSQQMLRARKDPIEMTSLVTTENPNHDGFDTAAANRVDKPIRGQETKFDGVIYHTGKEKTRVPDDQEYVALDMAEGWRFLKKDCPVEYRMDLASHERDQLGHKEESDWPPGLDAKPKDPWQFTRFLYLLNPLTAEMSTFASSTGGGRIAFENLEDQIARVRRVHPGSVPVIKLAMKPCSTRFGTKTRPHFAVVGWRNGGIAGVQPLQINPQSESEAPVADEIDDAICF